MILRGRPSFRERHAKITPLRRASCYRAPSRKAEFVAGLYVTLDFRLVKRSELSRRSVYQLFVRERGLRSEHAELLLSTDAAEAAAVLRRNGGGLWETQRLK